MKLDRIYRQGVELMRRKEKEIVDNKKYYQAGSYL